ncbi:hypothetical protein C8A00DRAFT_38940 [Chaetomidium leptoderma]|uniref:Uncharacterized protein n=1 Tax=Chaetomidium leptoderma TaxID=669021 RepID=A0AAN6VBN7_9PEZI|nr:hypothetical protein C8A00DRAFT_38940 [Chaetomidium leptoderma]
MFQESDIVTKASDRRIEHKLGLLKQELSIIDWTVDLQTHVLSKMLATTESLTRNPKVESLEDEWPVSDRRGRENEDQQSSLGGAPRYNTMAAMADSTLEPGEPCGFSHLLLHECLRHLALKRSEVKLMGDVVAHLTATNPNKINYTKDRQKRAIYAFTIVTVIFLPLSAVASIFGMNSADIRDTDLGQWAYWTTAVPVTVVVVFLGLLFTGELGTMRRCVGDVFDGVVSNTKSKGKKGWSGRGERVEVDRRGEKLDMGQRASVEEVRGVQRARRRVRRAVGRS